MHIKMNALNSVLLVVSLSLAQRLPLSRFIQRFETLDYSLKTLRQRHHVYRRSSLTASSSLNLSLTAFNR